MIWQSSYLLVPVFLISKVIAQIINGIFQVTVIYACSNLNVTEGLALFKPWAAFPAKTLFLMIKILRSKLTNRHHPLYIEICLAIQLCSGDPDQVLCPI